jgi:hypothetical protein
VLQPPPVRVLLVDPAALARPVGIGDALGDDALEALGDD